jgi:hypothetical protein
MSPVCVSEFEEKPDQALLMNIFCYPGVLRRAAVCSLLGIEAGLRPAFGVRPAIPLQRLELRAQCCLVAVIRAGHHHTAQQVGELQFRCLVSRSNVVSRGVAIMGTARSKKSGWSEAHM